MSPNKLFSFGDVIIYYTYTFLLPYFVKEMLIYWIQFHKVPWLSLYLPVDASGPSLVNMLFCTANVPTSVLSILIYLLSFISVLSLVVVSMLHILAGMIAYIILCAICATSIVGTVFVWWTYYRVKVKLDNTPFSQLLEENVHNEHALCIYGIICVVLTVSRIHTMCCVFGILYFLWNYMSCHTGMRWNNLITWLVDS